MIASDTSQFVADNRLLYLHETFAGSRIQGIYKSGKGQVGNPAEKEARHIMEWPGIFLSKGDFGQIEKHKSHSKRERKGDVKRKIINYCFI